MVSIFVNCADTSVYIDNDNSFRNNVEQDEGEVSSKSEKNKKKLNKIGKKRNKKNNRETKKIGRHFFVFFFLVF